jgi:glycosyltransferase 2 family protein
MTSHKTQNQGALAKWVGAILALAGLVAAVCLIADQGVDGIGHALETAGWGILWASLFRLIPIMIAGEGWRVLMPGRNRPFFFFTWLLWAREAINSLLPVAKVGGEIASVRMMRQAGFRASPAIASVIVETTLSVAAIFVYVLVGFGLLMTRGDDGQDITATAQMFWGLGLAIPVVAGVVAAQHYGLIGVIARIMEKSFADKWPNMVRSTARLDRQVRAMYARKTRILACFGWSVLSWFAGGLEIWIALYFLEVPVSLTDALLLDALLHAATMVFFIVPAGLGVQEGALLLFGTMIGLPPETCLALAVMRRCREIAIYVPALIVWAVQEGRLVLKVK